MCFYKFICCSLIGFLFVGCTNDERQIKREQSLFYDSNSEFDSGDFDGAINSYTKFINEVNDKDNTSVQFAYLQLAKIFFSKGNYDLAISNAEKVEDSDLFIELYLLEEEASVDYGPRGSSTEQEVNEISSYWYSLKDKAKTIIGMCYLIKSDYESAIENFKEIKTDEERYYYLGLAYGLKGDIDKQRKYFEKNIKRGSFKLIETTEWLNNKKFIVN